MPLLKCLVFDCFNTIDVTEPVFDQVNFICREHTTLAPDEVRFQEVQFDPDLASGASPEIDVGEDNRIQEIEEETELEEILEDLPLDE